MRDGWLPFGLVLLVGAAAPLACGQAFQLSGATGGGSSTATTGAGGAGGNTSATSTSGGASSGSVGSSTSTGMILGGPCALDAECKTVNDTLCGAGRCLQGKCVFKVLQNDGNSFSQIYGDCHVAKCSLAQLQNDKNNNDVYDDGNECTDDICTDGMPSNGPSAGNSCGANGVCNSLGACVQCTANDTTKCVGSKPHCVNGYCSAESCLNGVLDGTETDKDCGGPDCEPCGPGLHCNGAPDCSSDVCALPAPNAPDKLCLIAICSDGVKNGAETDIDCGGPGSGCPDTSRCVAGKHCSRPGDCNSGVCQAGVCKAPSCTDGVKNGTEKGVDCGALGCLVAKCPGG